MLFSFAFLGCSLMPSFSKGVKAPTPQKQEFELPATLRFTGFPPASGIATTYGRSIAVVVAIEDYKILADREGAGRVGQDVSLKLGERGFEVQTFLNGKASRKELYKYLFVDVPLMLSEHDRLFVYFVGHGDTDKDGSAVFMPYDAKDKTEGLSLSILQSLLENAPAKHTLIINDSVNSGVQRVQGSLIPDRDWNSCTRKRKHALLSSAQTQSSQVLSTMFLEALDGAGDINSDGIAVDDELLSKMYSSNPTMIWEATGDGCFSFKNEKVPNVRDTRFKVYDTKRVEAGAYKMGTANQRITVLQRRDELQHDVTITRDFYVGETEVTYALWEKIGRPIPKGVSLEEPIRNISWFDAIQFANDLSTFEGVKPCYEIKEDSVLWPEKFECEGWRLPSESEWEFFARAGATEDFATPTGQGSLPKDLEEQALCTNMPLSDESLFGDIAWFCGNSSKKVHSVKEKQANLLGLYDTIGNVWEWTWDWYKPYPDGILEDPSGPVNTDHLCSKDKPGRVLRGGSYKNDIATSRPAFRYCGEPNKKDNSIGIRLVRTAKD